MGKLRRVNGFVHHYMDEMCSRIVASSGQPGDRFHLGKLILQGLKDAPDFISQIDGATGKFETAESILERSVRCASCFKTLGLGCGDVVVTMAPSHVDLCVPVYAALFLGVTVSPIDWTLGVKECAKLLKISGPKLIFCQNEKSIQIQQALDMMNLDATLITFDESDSHMSFKVFHEKYEKPVMIDDFKPADINTEDNVAFFIWTSGTTGLPKAAATTHKNVTVNFPYWMSSYENFPTPTRLCMVTSPLQWVSAIAMFLLSPVLRFTRLQTSGPVTPDDALKMIRKYKPTFTVISPPLLTLLMKSKHSQAGDLASFDTLLIGGSTVTEDIFKNVKAVSPDTYMIHGYGMSEIGATLLSDGGQHMALKPLSLIKYRLVDPNTGLDVEEPNIHGELWMTGPSLFKGYHNNPSENKETLSEDGWLKSGDIFYRDNYGRYFFVERSKMLLKFRSHQISPVEIEAVIRQHPSVLDAAVGGIPDVEYGDLVVACVLRRHECHVTAQEIKDLVKESSQRARAKKIARQQKSTIMLNSADVKAARQAEVRAGKTSAQADAQRRQENAILNESLTESKQLRGGVIFLDKLPMTASSKINRKILRDIILNSERL